jgi:FAD/FMN-containing dehydrogenase
VLQFYAEYGLEAPDDLYLDGVLLSNPATDTSAVAFNICYSGPANRAEALLAKIRSAGTPVFDDVGPMDYTALQKSGDVSDPRAIGSYTKTGFATEISPAMIDAIVSGLEEDPGRNTVIGFQHGGGAITRVAPDATSFPHRDINYTGLLLVDWPVDSDPSRHVDWLQAYWDTIEPHTMGFYTNDVVDETQAQVDANYIGNFPRLLALKNRYDPTNLFRLNANIVPTA